MEHTHMPQANAKGCWGLCILGWLLTELNKRKLKEIDIFIARLEQPTCGLLNGMPVYYSSLVLVSPSYLHWTSCIPNPRGKTKKYPKEQRETSLSPSSLWLDFGNCQQGPEVVSWKNKRCSKPNGNTGWPVMLWLFFTLHNASTLQLAQLLQQRGWTQPCYFVHRAGKAISGWTL